MALMLNGKKVLGNETKTLTAAEFQQLSQAEKDNGTIYYITDGTGESSDFRPVIYSEKEREIGVWIDGKPLYEKTLTGTATISTPVTGIFYFNQIDISSMGIDKGFFVPEGSYYIDGSNEFSFVYGCASSSYIQIWTHYQRTNVPYVITIRYTKLTDAPGSGTWTPQSVPAVHYSENEHVVGTWIDGSTLYERTKRIAVNSSGVITLWTDSSVVVRNYEGVFIFRGSESTLTLWSRPSDNTYRATVEGVGNSTTYGVYADIQLGTGRTNKLDLCLTVRYTKTSS